MGQIHRFRCRRCLNGRLGKQSMALTRTPVLIQIHFHLLEWSLAAKTPVCLHGSKGRRYIFFVAWVLTDVKLGEGGFSSMADRSQVRDGRNGNPFCAYFLLGEIFFSLFFSFISMNPV